MRLLKLLFIFIIICIFHTKSKSQTSIIDVEIMDTIIYYGEKVILYDNNTWEFLYEIEKLKRDQALSDTMELFTNYWDNDQLFSYTWPNKPIIPDTVEIILVDTLRRFVLPYYNRINSGYGWRGRRIHNGIDVHLSKGEPVKNAFDGKVRYAKFNTGGYGKIVIIRHFNGLETYYAHLDNIYVEPNQIVKAGQIIGTGGNTGATWTGDHLHFEIRYMDKAFDPLSIIEFDSLRLVSDTLILTKESFKITTTHKGTPTNKSLSNYSYDPNATYHVVRKGDTLGHIATQYKTSVDRLCKINNINRNSILRIGQKIRVK